MNGDKDINEVAGGEATETPVARESSADDRITIDSGAGLECGNSFYSSQGATDTAPSVTVNRAKELNDSLFSYSQKRKTEPSDDIFGASKLRRASQTKRIWNRVLMGALCAIIGFFGAVGGIYFLSQTGFVDNNSMLGNLIVNSSGLEVHKVTVNESDLEYTGGYIDVSEKVIESVVELTELTSDGEGGYITYGNASGVIISEDGYIVTNEHVTNGMDNIRVKLQDGSEYIADIIGSDAMTDLAVIKISLPHGVKLMPATFGISSNVKYGQKVVVVGNPMGIGTTVSIGIVSCPDRIIDSNGDKINAIQTDAAVSPGNSGGGMFDVYGNLLGVVCAKSTGSGVEGIGYAVPVDTAKKVIDDILTYGYVKGRAALGVQVASVLDKSSYDYWAENDLKGYLYDYRFGIYVTATLRASELKRGDRLLEIDGKAVSSSLVITEYLKKCKPGDILTIKIERLTSQPNDGSAVEILEIQIELYERDW